MVPRFLKRLGTDLAIGAIEGLELLMNQAGLAMANALLDLRIKNFENRLAAAAPPRR